MDIKDSVKNPDVWLRGVFILIFGVILVVNLFLVMLVIIFQFVTKLLTGDLNRQLADFSVGLVRYVSEILSYITFQTDDSPFPFSPSSEERKNTPAAKPRSRRRTTRTSARKKEQQ